MIFPDTTPVMTKEAYRPSSTRHAIGCPRIMELMVFVLSIAVITACTLPPSPQLPTVTETSMAVKTPHPNETATPQIVATVLMAKLIGKLNIIDGCVRVIDRVDNVSHLLVWPPDFEATIEKDTLRVIGGKVSGNHTEVVLHDGDKVFFGGGEISQPNEQLLSSEPPNCPGPYWLVGSSGEQYPVPNETNP